MIIGAPLVLQLKLGVEAPMEPLDIVRKNPGDGFDINIDWTAWLPGAATVASCTWALSDGISKDDARTINTGKTSTLWILGGTAGSYYLVQARMTGSNGVVKDRTLVIRVAE